jgi:hypothetical protein
MPPPNAQDFTVLDCATAQSDNRNDPWKFTNVPPTKVAVLLRNVHDSPAKKPLINVTAPADPVSATALLPTKEQLEAVTFPDVVIMTPPPLSSAVFVDISQDLSVRPEYEPMKTAPPLDACDRDSVQFATSTDADFKTKKAPPDDEARFL